MVIALTPFECMCGFRTIPDIAQNLIDFPEFVSIIDHACKIAKLCVTPVSLCAACHIYVLT